MKTIFWNVDTQYDFIMDNHAYKGKLAIPKAMEITDKLAYLSVLAQKRNIQVVNTGDWHTKDSKELSDKPDFKTTFPEHCMIDSYGARFIPETVPDNPYVIDWRDSGFDLTKVNSKRNIVLYKDEFDVFSGTKHADPVLKAISPDRAIVYGVATNVCVDFAVLGLLKRNVQVYVVTDAIKELPGLPLPYDSWKGAILVKAKDLEEILGQ